MPIIHSLRHLPRGPPEIVRDASYIPPIPSSTCPSAEVDMTRAGHHPGNTLEHVGFSRRRTALSYRSLDTGDSRDRNYSRSHKNLVVVTPPPDLPLQKGQLGLVLSAGPLHRLPHGILMPLFSSMHGQLNAISREYNFPSIMGLCLYLHIDENGITMTPRISEDSWQYLFGHFFESRPPSGSQQLPIVGRIEFDIDLNKARWFDAWISGILWDSDPFLQTVTSEETLAIHRRGESQPSDELPTRDQWNTPGPHTPTNLRPEAPRHLPKKLSLVDRLGSLYVPPRLQSHSRQLDSAHTHQFAALSPVPQSVVPRITKNELAYRTNWWQEITDLYPVPTTETQRLRVDGGESASVMDVGSVNIDKDLWPITSVGLNGLVVKSPVASPRLTLAHLGCRVDGTTPPISSTVTSWGPPDDEWGSVFSNVTRFPSPGIGERVIEDILAPRPRAVWGNSFGWRSAATWKNVYPFSVGPTKSVNQVEAQDSGVLMPQVIYAADRSQVSPNITAQRQTPALSVWGRSFGWQRAGTWNKVYPYSTVAMLPVASIQFRGAGGLVPEYPNLCMYPMTYPNLEIYPTCTIEENVARPVLLTSNKSNNRAMHYPNLVIYPPVYPYFNIYPSVIKDVKLSSTCSPNKGPTAADVTVGQHAIWGRSFGWEIATTWRAVWPTTHSTHVLTDLNVYLTPTRRSQDNDQTSDMINVGRSPDADLGQLVSDDIESTEARYQPWQFVWPFFGNEGQARSVISRPQLVVHSASENVLSLKNQASEMLTNLNCYPTFDIYPSVYPYLNIYPAIDLRLEDHPKTIPNVWQKQVETKLPSLYPSFDIYHACYPYNLDHIYPSINATEPMQSKHMWRESVAYPHFNLYPAVQTLSPQQERVVQDVDVSDSAAQREREAYVGLDATPSLCLENWSRRNSKTHLQLHTEVFQDGVVWTPSGYTQDLSSLTTRQRKDIQVQEVHRRPCPSCLTSGSSSVKSPDKTVFPVVSPLHDHSLGIASESSLIASEAIEPHVCSLTNGFAHERTSYRLSQAVESTAPGAHKRNSSSTSGSQFLSRLRPLVDRRQTVVSPLPNKSTPKFLKYAPQGLQIMEGTVLQRVRAYEQSTIERSR